MSVTFSILQDECNACGECIRPSNNEIAINSSNVAYFKKTNSHTASFGSVEVGFIYAAQDKCPKDCIKEVG